MVATLRAPGTPVLTKCVSLVFCNERNAASELEKNAEKIRKSKLTTRTDNSPSFMTVSYSSGL